MKKWNLYFRDRKILYLTLSILLVFIFTLTIVYAALNVTLNIVGNAEVIASSWDIHLDNVKVTSGSVNGSCPSIISSTTATFSTTLTNPGDFYEFTIDVVNDGSIDAMIDSIVKEPELTSEQSKYLKYEVMYQNGEDINIRQSLNKGTRIPVKVRVEFKKNIIVSDLPTKTTTLNLKLTLVYSQSDGTSDYVANNGVAIAMANGNLNNIGTVVTIGNQQFYTIGIEGENIKLLSKYNLYVGYTSSDTFTSKLIENPTGVQDKSAIGSFEGYNASNPIVGTILFSSYIYWKQLVNEYPTYVYSSDADIHIYVEEYKDYLETLGVQISSARLINYDELILLGCDFVNENCLNSSFPWVYSTSYWTGVARDANKFMWGVENSGNLGFFPCSNNVVYGVRPVILINRNLIGEKVLNSFFVDGVSYQVEEGMNWVEWVNSEYNTIGFVLYNGEVYSKNFFETLYDYYGVVDANSLIEAGYDYHLGLSNYIP